MANYQLAANQLHYVTVEELRRWQAAGRQLRLFDTRPAADFERGTIRGASGLASGGSTGRDRFPERVAQQLAARARDEPAEELVFCAAACSSHELDRQDQTSDVFLLDLLFFLGVPHERLWRLEGGYGAWEASGGALETPPRGADAVADLPSLLAAEGLSHLEGLVAGETLERMLATLADEGGRLALLALLKTLGVAKLSERQRLASACAKARRAR